MTSDPSPADISTFADFVQVIEVLPFVSGVSIYRGQTVRGNLIPSVCRQNPTRDTTDLEREALKQVSLLGAKLLPSPLPPLLDLMVTAQHFGLKTRLLDWTSNPLAALWFACADPNPGDAYVYALDADTLFAGDLYSSDPFAQNETRVFQPRQTNPRIVAQHGWFTLHRYSTKDGQFVPLERHATLKMHLTEFRIPAGSRLGMLRSLDRHGTNQRVLFPDLEGLCRYVDWRSNAT
jgi:hypothetical protein